MWYIWNRHTHGDMYCNDPISHIILKIHNRAAIPIAGYISNILGYEFRSEWIFELFFLFGIFIFFIFLVFENYSFSDFINLFNRNRKRK